MNIGGIISSSFTPYPGIAYEIYVSGCTRHCKECHNPEMWDFNYGTSLDMEKLLEDMKSRRKEFDIVAILGGDLLCHSTGEAMQFMVPLLSHFKNKKFWLFTGADLEDIPDVYFEMFDVIKYGPYKDEQKQQGFPASKNQGVWKKKCGTKKQRKNTV